MSVPDDKGHGSWQSFCYKEWTHCLYSEYDDSRFLWNYDIQYQVLTVV